LQVNGKRIAKHELRTGDTIRFGAPDGPEARIEVTIDATYDPSQDAADIAKVLQATVRGSGTGQILALTAQRIAEERAKAGGTRSRKRWITSRPRSGSLRSDEAADQEALGPGGGNRLSGCVGGDRGDGDRHLRAAPADRAAARRQGRFDAQIHDIQQQMQAEQDSTRLALLEQRFLDATSNAERTLADLARADRAKAVEAANAGDELDREIRAILRQFDAETYAVPPIFRSGSNTISTSC
jgi:hypothetical protein